MHGKHNSADKKMNPILFQTTDLRAIPATAHKGETGEAFWRTLKLDGLRVRLVEYSAGYKADHWCKIGHIVYCLEGEMISELVDGREFKLSAGMTYVVSDNVSMHRSHSKDGVKLLIIDGNFLKNQTGHIVNPWKI
jgi:quercetin dioxygenase-like cupin family protein